MARRPSQEQGTPLKPRPSRPGTGGAAKAGSVPPRAMALVPAKKPTAPAKPGQHALVVGVSNYPAPIPKLPAVAADVKGVARVLASRNGTFPSDGVTVLTDKMATREQVLVSLKAALTGAKAEDTVFVYLAGHGSVEGGKYYYIAHDSEVGRLSETGVPLATIKRLFTATASRRVFLWLDFCHAGGITERGTAVEDVAAVRREIGVISGEGKIIVAACTPSQSAYEDAGIGHGLFTHALLRGLKGEAKSAQGEVTAMSLYDFIDREVKHPNQQPTFFGRLSGRIVLTHYPTASRTKPATPVAPKPSATVKASRPLATGGANPSNSLILLDGRVYAVPSVSEATDGDIEAQIVDPNAEEEVALRSLKGDRYGGRDISVAFNNQAFKGRVENVSFQTTGSKSVCTVTLKAVKRDRSFAYGMTYNGVTLEQQAEMRARVILLDEKPSIWEAGRDQSLRPYVLRPLEEAGLEGGIFPAIRKSWKSSQAELLRVARLWAVHYLKSCDACDEILELKLGPVRAGRLSVRFRGGVKGEYSGKSHEFLVEGTSPF